MTTQEFLAMDSDNLHNNILIAIELYNYKNLSDKFINILPLLKKEFVYLGWHQMMVQVPELPHGFDLNGVLGS